MATFTGLNFFGHWIAALRTAGITCLGEAPFVRLWFGLCRAEDRTLLIGSSIMSPQASQVPRGASAGIATDLDLLKNTQAYLRARQQNRPPNPQWLRCWERFYETYDPLLWRFAFSCHVARSDLNDCVQDSWAAIAARLPDLNYDPVRAPLHSWLYAIVHSKAVDILRRRSRHPFQDNQHGTVISVASCESDPALAYERHRQQTIVHHVVSKLRDRVSTVNYQVFCLRSLESRSVSETAAALGLTTNQVRFRHHRMMKKFARLYELYVAQEHKD